MVKAVYIHIPFCTSICSYCDFCKFYYNEKWIKEYLRALKREIKEKYKGEGIKTLYIGGGTPSSLNIDLLKELFEIVSSFNLEPGYEFTFECNSEDLTKEKLELFKRNGINRLSIGIQTFNEKHLVTINRKLNIENVKMALMYFENVNFDLMYALPNETLEELRSDLEKALSLKPKHISIYSLIVEPHTKFYIYKVSEVEEELQRKMYDYICVILEESGYNHYEISNFSKQGYESKHNLVYWNNEEYYGFGIGASGYLNNIRYDNTKSINKYLSGESIFYKEVIDFERKLEDEFMLGFRKIKGIEKNVFWQKYQFDILDIELVKEFLQLKLLIDDGINIKINPKYIYVSNEIIEKFIDSDLLVH